MSDLITTFISHSLCKEIYLTNTGERNRAFSMAQWVEPTYNARSRERHGFDPWVGKMPWKRKWQPTPVFLRG